MDFLRGLSASAVSSVRPNLREGRRLRFIWELRPAF